MRRAGAAMFTVGLLTACANGASSPTGGDDMDLSSSAFAEGGSIPARHTCDGEDVSPPLAWDGVPEGTAAFALLVEDPDARDFVHWVLVDLPAERRSVAQEEGDGIATPGRNDFGGVGWAGPCPPRGEHRYVFTLYALSTPLALSGVPDAAAVRAAMSGRVLAEARLTGVYARAG